MYENRKRRWGQETQQKKKEKGNKEKEMKHKVLLKIPFEYFKYQNQVLIDWGNPESQKTENGGMVKSNITNLKIENDDMVKGQKIKKRKFMKGINSNNKSRYQIFMKMNEVIYRFLSSFYVYLMNISQVG